MKSLLILAFVFMYSAFCNVSYADNEIGCERNIKIIKGGSYRLNNKCSYESIRIYSSNVNVNCNNAMFDGKGNAAIAVLISGAGKGISKVSLSDCKINNFNNIGVKITSGIPQRKVTAIARKKPSFLASKVTLRNIQINKVRNVGVYIDSYSNNILLNNLYISNVGGVGVYFEQGSNNNNLSESEIVNNGFLNKNNPREGVAIDSSAKNTIEDNNISNNAAGGVFLYKNCGEHFSIQHVIRYQHSNNNSILRNKLANQKYGVWIASRQTRDLSEWDCADEPLDSNKRYYKDYADYNRVVDNFFCDNKIDIRVEGNYNVVEGNKLTNKKEGNIIIPSQEVYRKTNVILKGNVVKNNVYSECNRFR